VGVGGVGVETGVCAVNTCTASRTTSERDGTVGEICESSAASKSGGNLTDTLGDTPTSKEL